MNPKRIELMHLISSYELGGYNYRGRLLVDTLWFAWQAHGDQTRKWSDEPYLFHPIEVMHTVEIGTYSLWPDAVRDRVLCAAILHDTLEDTSVTFGELNDRFGTVVANMVLGLTKCSTPEDGNREERLRMECEHLTNQSTYVQTIKCADIVSNCRNIATRDKSFAKIYLAEKEAQLNCMYQADGILRDLALRVVQTEMRNL